ncbi:DUF4136 domain-containing protein [Methylogaea oryzae]|uniref:DUF4136 domain-containing protein n=1 Tax=Methylogaea oryzae TaxID=1295382 RepID=A0A8D5AGT7_9GAMM|nr:DUF4136 domain-containing protein [Methylogaea oryzae]BBL69551.1 hypothetical protein MoryE10_01570 [Methylogaea oryzae]
MPDLFPPRRLRPVWLAVCCLALAACGASNPRVSYDYDPAADFANFKQFAWANPATPRRPDDPLLDNSLLDDRIKTVIEHQLLQKGITRSSNGSAPDFLVSYQVVTRKYRAASPAPFAYSPFYPYGMGYGYGRGGWAYGGAWGMAGDYWEEYESHSLVVDFLQPATGKQLWRGVLHDALELTGDPAAQKYHLDGKVHYLLQKFPPLLAPRKPAD